MINKLRIGILLACLGVFLFSGIVLYAQENPEIFKLSFDEDGANVKDANGRYVGETSGGLLRPDGQSGKALGWGDAAGQLQFKMKSLGQQFGNRFSLDLWIYPERVNTCTIIDFGGNHGFRVGLKSWGGLLCPDITLFLKKGWCTLNSVSIGLPLKTWSRLTVVYDGPAEKAALFINGRLSEEQDLKDFADTSIVFPGNSVMTIKGGGDSFQGRIDEFGVSNGIRFPESFRWDPGVYLYALRHRSSFLLGIGPASGNVKYPAKVSFTLMGANSGKLITEKIAEASDVFKGMEISVKSLPTGEYRATVSYLYPDGTSKEIMSRWILYTPADSNAIAKLRADGVLLVDGKPMFPLGVFAVPAKDLQLAADSGFNIVLPFLDPNDPKIIDKCLSEKGGLDKLSGLIKNYQNESTKHGIRLMPSAINDISDYEVKAWYQSLRKNQPQVCWYFSKWTEYPQRMERIGNYEELVRWDPNHPVLSTDPDGGAYGRGCDIISLSRTSANHLYHAPDFFWIAQAVRESNALACGLKPVWAELALHTEKSARKERAGIKPPIGLTRQEMANVCYVALASGARGLLFRSFKEKFPGENQDVWADYKEVWKELRKHEEIWTAPLAEAIIECDNSKAVVSTKPYFYNKNYYFLVANPYSEDLVLKINIKTLKTGDAKVTDEFRTFETSSEDGILSVVLKPLEVKLYRIPTGR